MRKRQSIPPQWPGDLADSIVYLCALIADRPRPIDRYIDYFGEKR